ncbi:hypothetical protein DPMN_124667 [Dreissena polymorpha]|uniref:Uncharacterized protein n=1 Tax=Dreissena polymorpha TaxID=45954 RepID=A0A9D4JU08_DREPO|nr:hypothetical protein DPMN_124667 [Dreissena polymorpha]
MKKALAEHGRRDGLVMRAAVNPAPANEPLPQARRRRRVAEDKALTHEPAPDPIPGREPEAASAPATPAKRRRRGG